MAILGVRGLVAPGSSADKTRRPWAAAHGTPSGTAQAFQYSRFVGAR